MKYNVFRVLCVAVGVLCIGMYGAASTSVIQKKRMCCEEGFDPENVDCKSLRCQSTGKIPIHREPYMVEEVGQLRLVDQIDLSKIDPITQCAFIDHIKKDYERGVPTLLALLQFGVENGFATKDYAIAGSLYRYFIARKNNEGPLVHPFYNGELYDNIEYHLLEINENSFETRFLGIDRQVFSEDPHVWVLRRLLNMQEITAQGLSDIGYEFNRLHDFDSAIEWLQRGLIACKSDAAFNNNSQSSLYVDLLCDLASLYERKGCIEKACQLYRASIMLGSKSINPYIGILYISIYALERCAISYEEKKMYALKFIESSKDMIGVDAYKKLYSMRYAQVVAYAEKLLLYS
jgi:tetratricopeptide (TPR) repeat protein